MKCLWHAAGAYARACRDGAMPQVEAAAKELESAAQTFARVDAIDWPQCETCAAVERSIQERAASQATQGGSR